MARNISRVLILSLALAPWLSAQDRPILPTAPNIVNTPIYMTHVTVIDTKSGKEARPRRHHAFHHGCRQAGCSARAAHAGDKLDRRTEEVTLLARTKLSGLRDPYRITVWRRKNAAGLRNAGDFVDCALNHEDPGNYRFVANDKHLFEESAFKCLVPLTRCI